METERTELMKFFTYGTLMRGEKNENHLEGATFLGEVEVHGFQLLDIQGTNFPFPGMVFGEGTVKGELYEITKKMVTSMDVLEGHPDFYIRETITLPDGGKAIAYLANDERLFDNPVIESGCWKEHQRKETT